MNEKEEIKFDIDSSKKISKLRNSILELSICSAVALILAFFIITFLAQLTHVGGSSMYPTLSNGDTITVEKFSYRFSDPERFDVVVFPYEEDTGETRNYIKRIIGLPGETIQIKDGVIYIDEVPLEEDFGFEGINTGGWAEEPIDIGYNEYFVLGDNRNNSKDSRHLDENEESDIGLINKDEIIGKAWFRIYPIGKIGMIK